VSAKLQQVHVRVNDAATGKPTPCRVRLTDDQHQCYAPFGRTAEVPYAFEVCGRNIPGYVSDKETWTYIDGACEIELPPATLHVVIEKGPEYERLERQITLAPGKLALRFDLNRLISPSGSGWYAGAMARTALSPHEVLLEGSAEGLRVIDLLAYEREATVDGTECWPRWTTWPTWKQDAPESLRSDTAHHALPTDALVDYPNLAAFSGQRPCLETPDCLVAVNTLNRHASLGELALLNCHRIVFPLRVGRWTRPALARYRPDDWALADWCDQCHRKRGLVIGRALHWSDSDRWYGGEVLADAILGKIDAVSFWEDAVDWWYTLLSMGLRLPIVANLLLRPLGMQRTFARLQSGQEFSYANWIEAIRAGRTAVSWGPFVTLTVNGHDPGACVDLDHGDKQIEIRAEATAREAFDELQIVHDGDIVLRGHPRRDGVFQARLAADHALTRSGWLAARCTGLATSPTQNIDAHTSPIYIRVDGQPPPVDVDAIRRVIYMLDQTLGWVQSDAECPTPKDRERLASVFLEARRVLEARIAGHN
jgi:hypothetical protein